MSVATETDSLASTISNIAAYSDALVVLGTAGVLMPVARRVGINPIIGYLVAGAVLGPHGFGAFVETLPFLRWLTVTDTQNVAGIAEFGIVFLLFLIGLEMTFERLNALKRAIVGLGGSQWLVSTAIIGMVAYALGQPAVAALVLGGCLALSSTAIVVELLSSRNRMTTTVGRTSFAVLLAQDLAVIPLLIFVAILGAGGGGNVLQTIGMALVQAAIALAAIVLFGRTLLRPLFRLVGEAQSKELFIAATLFVILSTGIIAALAGLSMALGAFVAGLLLAETEYRKGIEALVDPFKGLLLGIFFFTVGMVIDIRAVLANPLAIFGAILALLAVKGVIIAAIMKAGGLSNRVAIETGLLLAPGGELAFVGISAALAANALSKEVASFTMVVIALSMALTPLLSSIADRIRLRMIAREPVDPELLIRPSSESRHAIVVGHGRVGRVVCAMLDHHKLPYIATDFDARSVSADRKTGHKVFYGDATDATFLALCNIQNAAAVIITIHTPSAIERMVSAVRSLRPDIPIISRARDAAHASKLYRMGVNDAVPETIEASLQLSEAALVGIGVPVGYVIASIHEKRDGFRAEMMAAAQSAGVDTTRSVRKRIAE